MRALHRSAADVERRADPFVHAERFNPDCGANDVHNRVNRANFVKMDALDINVVYAGFGRSQRFKYRNCPLFGGRADGRALNDLANFFQSAMMVFVAVFMSSVTVVMRVLMRMTVLV